MGDVSCRPAPVQSAKQHVDGDMRCAVYLHAVGFVASVDVKEWSARQQRVRAINDKCYSMDVERHKTTKTTNPRCWRGGGFGVNRARGWYMRWSTRHASVHTTTPFEGAPATTHPKPPPSSSPTARMRVYGTITTFVSPVHANVATMSRKP